MCFLLGCSGLTCCLLLFPLIVRFCNCSTFCCTFLYVPSSFEIILMGRRELVALLSLPSWCLVIVVWLFLAVPLVSLQCVIVVFPDHTYYFGFFPVVAVVVVSLLVVTVVAGFSLFSLFITLVNVYVDLLVFTRIASTS